MGEPGLKILFLLVFVIFFPVASGQTDDDLEVDFLLEEIDQELQEDEDFLVDEIFSAPRPDSRRRGPGHERAWLAQVSTVERWTMIEGPISKKENFAPSVVKLGKGGYRIYWNDFRQGGITSAWSKDGRVFQVEKGLRLRNNQKKALDCIASHPWVVEMDGGYRMYYQGDARCSQGPRQEHEYRIFSAFSSDGLVFEREGVRIDIGEGTGLTQAAHGRILRLADGSYRMYFSANFRGRNTPADILGATSRDGLSWVLDKEPILRQGHDPTVILVSGEILMYTTFLGDNFLVLKSLDGLSFEPVAWLEFYDKKGRRIEEFGDADAYLDSAGRLLLCGSGKGSPGLGLFVKSSKGP